MTVHFSDTLFLCGKSVKFASQSNHRVSSAFLDHSVAFILQVGCISQDCSLLGWDWSRKEREARKGGKPWDPVLTYTTLLHRSHSNQSLWQTARGHFHLKGWFPNPQDSFWWNHCNFYLYLGSSVKAWPFSISLYNNKDLNLNLQSSGWRKNSSISLSAVLCQPHRPVRVANAPTTLWSSWELCNFMPRGINPSSKCWILSATGSGHIIMQLARIAGGLVCPVTDSIFSQQCWFRAGR